MAQPQVNISLTAPGFAGVNTQDSPLDMEVQYAAEADNCVIDNFGRISSRKGFKYITTNPDVLGGGPVETVFEFLRQDTGAQFIFACGNNKIFIQQTVAPFELVELTLPALYTITANDWCIASLNNKCFFVQAGHEPLVFEPSVSTTALRAFDDGSGGPTWSIGYPNVCHAAFGRLFLGEFDNSKEIVWYSSLLNGDSYTGSGAGTFTTNWYWPSGFDNISAIHAHNNFLVVFGKSNILLYTTDTDVDNNLKLIDTIENIGCVARDSIVSTGIDLMFLDGTGVRSLNRTVQEKSVPVGDISRNVRQDLQNQIRSADNSTISAVFDTNESIYITFVPSAPVAYVFDTWNPLPPYGAARVTTWSRLRVQCGVRLNNGNSVFGGLGGVYTYEGGNDIYLDSNEDPVVEEIPMTYITHPMDFNSPSNLVFPKQVDVTVLGALDGTLTLKWGYDYLPAVEPRAIRKALTTATPTFFYPAGTDVDTTPNIGEYFDPNNPAAVEGVTGFYTSSSTFNVLKYNIWGSGRNIRLGFFASTFGFPISIQEINIQALQGRIL